jgi:hypothetical protein
VAVTCLTDTFKQELLMGGHCFMQAVTATGAAASAATSVTSVSSVAGIVTGMSVSGTNVATGSVIASVDSSSSFTLSKPTLGTISGGTFSLAGDVFKMCLIKPSPSNTYDATLANYSAVGTDEVTGTGYTAGGVVLSNVSPALASGVGYVTFSPDPSWPGASFSTVAAVIYNTSKRAGAVSGRTVGVFDLGGTQTVSGGGTMTLVLPVSAYGTALIRLS